MRKKFSLKFKIVIGVAFLIVVFSSVTAFFLTRHSRAQSWEYELRVMNIIGQSLASNAEYGMLIEDKEILLNHLNNALDEGEVVAAMITDTQGGVQAQLGLEISGEEFEKIKSIIAGIQRLDAEYSKIHLEAYGDVYILPMPIYSPVSAASEESMLFEEEMVAKRQLGDATVIFSTEHIEKSIRKAQMQIVVVICVIGTVVMIIVFLMAGLVIRDINKLNEALDKVRHGVFLGSEVQIHTRDEIEELAEGFNKMTRELQRTTVSRNMLIVERDKAEQANRAKSEFLANMSHEIRTPLNAVIGFTDLLKQEELNETQRDYVESVGQSAELLLNIISDILDFSKIEAHERNLENIPFNLKDVAATILMIAKGRLKEKSTVKLFLEYENETPDSFVGDPTAVRQILLNLVSNALKFTHEGNVTIHIRALDKEIQESKGEEPAEFYTLELNIKDTGIGIPQDKQKAIFESFSQVDTSTTRKYGGTGLGLAITKSLVLLMGGRIDLESSPKKGSTFTVTLRFRKSKESVQTHLKEKTEIKKSDTDSAIKEVMQQPADFKGIKVLIVEDNIMNQKLINVILEGMNIETHLVANGKQAVEAIKETDYDLCLMDLQMPVMGGIEATQIIRKELKKDIPIIALTAAVTKQDVEKAKLAGMNDFLPKPISAQVLKAKISALIWRE